MATPLLDGSKAQFVDLLSTCPVVEGATVSKALLNLPESKVVLFAMDAGQELSEHRAPFMGTVQVLDGRLRFGIEGQEREMVANDWLVMPANAAHRLTALEPTRFLLVLFKKPA